MPLSATGCAGLIAGVVLDTELFIDPSIESAIDAAERGVFKVEATAAVSIELIPPGLTGVNKFAGILIGVEGGVVEDVPEKVGPVVDPLLLPIDPVE